MIQHDFFFLIQQKYKVKKNYKCYKTIETNNNFKISFLLDNDIIKML